MLLTRMQSFAVDTTRNLGLAYRAALIAGLIVFGLWLLVQVSAEFW